MKNTRTKQTPIQRAMKIVTSITLLAMLFVLVLAGTLSGAFGVEENLVQNGKIEGNVASATVTIPSNANTTPSENDGSLVVVENNISDGGSYKLTTSDWLTDSEYRIPTNSTGNRGWGFWSGSTDTDRHAILKMNLPTSVINALKNEISITVSLTAIQRGSGDSDWGTMGIYSDKPTGYAIGHRSSFLNNDYFWSTEPKNAIALQHKKDVEWSEDQGKGDKTIFGEIPKNCTSIFLGFHARRSGNWGIAWDYIRVSFTFESGVTITTAVGANGSISPVGTTYTITGTNDNKSVTATPNTGYHFTGWTYNGGTNRIDNVSQVGGAFSFNGSNIINGKTYTANFAINQLNVTYHTNLNGSNRDDGTEVFTYNSLGTSYLKSPEKLDGYTFVGWAISSGGNVYHKYGENVGNSIAGVDFSKAENHGKTVHLYAVWVASDFDIIAGGNKDNGTWGSKDNPFAITTPQHLKTCPISSMGCAILWTACPARIMGKR